MEIKVALLGRNGLGVLDASVLKNRVVKRVDNTPYGKPTGDLILGQINGINVVILERFGPHFDKTFHNINHRANIWALKEEECTHIISVAASDTLYKHIKVGDVVILDDFIDFTHNRKQSFYDGEPGHLQGNCSIQLCCYGIFNEELRQVLIEAAKEIELSYHPEGTSIIMEGPQYASLGEAEMFRKWGGHLVNHVIIPEVVLAKECAMCYACLAFVSTEFDSGKPKFHESITQFNKFLPKMKQYIQAVLPKIMERDWTSIIDGLNNNVANCHAVTNSTLRL